jgi:ribosomal protein S6
MPETEDLKEAQTVYELGYLVLPSIAEDSLGNVVESLRSIIAKSGCTEIAGEAPIKQDLAYTMSKTVGASHYVVNDAYLGWIKFECEPGAVLKVKSAVEKIDEILRFLLVKAPRETTFTFAEARRAQEEKNNPVEEKEGAPVAEAEPVVE